MMAPDRRGKHLLMEPKLASVNVLLMGDTGSSWKTPVNGAQVAASELVTDGGHGIVGPSGPSSQTTWDIISKLQTKSFPRE